MQRMMLFLVLIVWVFAPIAYFLNTVRMFMKDMWTLMELHLVWFKAGVPENSRALHMTSDSITSKHTRKGTFTMVLDEAP